MKYSRHSYEGLEVSNRNGIQYSDDRVSHRERVETIVHRHLSEVA